MIDFSKMADTKIFSGRQNGVKARIHFNIHESKKYRIKTTDDQLITSSYFLGLLGDLLSRQFSSPNEVLGAIDFEESSEKSKIEMVKAVRRGLSTHKRLV